MKVRAWVGLAVVAASLVASGCGDEEEALGPSPLHAVGSVLQVSDGSGEVTLAQLILVTTVNGAPEFVDSALAPTLKYEGEARELNGQRVRLRQDDGSTQETTFYQLSSRQDAQLAYAEGAEYVFNFTVDGPEAGPYAGEILELRVQAPTVPPSIERVSEPGRETLLDVATPSGYAAGILQVDRPTSNETTFVSFPYSDRFLMSAAELLESRGELERFKGGVVTAPASSFNRAGTHVVSFIGLEVSTSGQGIGAQSFGFVGAASSLSVDIP